MHLRRALLLFAIVLGMAALVASLSRPVDDRRRAAPPTQSGTGDATVVPRPTPSGTGERPRTLAFEAPERESRKLSAGEAATVEVAVTRPGDVAIPDLGLTAAADPATPARFDVLATQPGRYRLVFTPAGEEHAEPAGSLVVTSRG